MSGALWPWWGPAAGFLGLLAAPEGAAPALSAESREGCSGFAYLAAWGCTLALCALVNKLRGEPWINSTRIALWVVAVLWIGELVLVTGFSCTGNVPPERAGYLSGYVIGKGLIPFVVAWVVDNRRQKKKKEEENPAQHF